MISINIMFFRFYHYRSFKYFYNHAAPLELCFFVVLGCYKYVAPLELCFGRLSECYKHAAPLELYFFV